MKPTWRAFVTPATVLLFLSWAVSRCLMFYRWPDRGQAQVLFDLVDAWFAGRTPYLERFFEYPPGVIWLSAPLRALTSDPDTFAVLFGLLMLLFDAICLGCMWRLCELVFGASSPPSGTQGPADQLECSPKESPRRVAATRYIAVAALYITSTSLLGRTLIQSYEIVIGALVLAATVAVLASRRRFADVMLGAAIGCKLLPVLVVPIYLTYLWTRDTATQGASPSATGVKHGAGAGEWDAVAPKFNELGGLWHWMRREGLRRIAWQGATVFALFVPFLVLSGWESFSFVRNYGARGLEVGSTWSVLLLLVDPTNGSTRDGLLSPETVHPYATALASLSGAVVLAGVGVTWWIAHRRWLSDKKAGLGPTPQSLVAAVGAALALSILAAKVFSPQYLLCVAPLLCWLAVCLDSRTVVGKVLRVLVIFACTMLVTCVFAKALLDPNLIPLLLLLARAVLLAFFAVQLLLFVRQPPDQGPAPAGSISGASKQTATLQPRSTPDALATSLSAQAALFDWNELARLLVVTFKRRALQGTLLAVVALLLPLGWALGSLPGLHGDEAWVLLAVRWIASGERPWNGMNDYTGPILAYLSWPFMETLGVTIGVARGLAVALNVGALLIVSWVARRVLRLQGAALLCVVAMATSPLFVVYARRAIELTAVIPLLVFGGIALVLRATLPSADECWPGRPSHNAALFAFAGGFGVGFAAYTHVAGILLPFALGAACAILWRGRLLRQAALWWALFGLAVGAAPRWVQVLHAGPGSFETRLGQRDWSAVAEDLASLPGVLSGIIDGDLLYLRITGHMVMRVLPYASVVVVGLTLWRIARLRALPFDAREKVLGLLLPILVLGIVFASPFFAVRYFVSMGVVVLLWCGVLVDRLLGFEGGRVGRGALRAALPLLIIGNVAYVGTNYYYGFASTGGVLSVVPIGK
ncbi:MAG: glycosyltransferase 87 family protein, partial [Polyangiaceae bacterium]|nr:glycosyltransferase 87 family protein [Polyangiaceae bacterium]